MFPSINALRTTAFQQRPNSATEFNAAGFPYVIQNFTARKHDIEAQYLITSAEWDSLIAHYETNHSTAFTWNDDRESPAVSRTVYYNGRPFRSQVGQGVLPNTKHFVTVRLIEQ